MVYMNGWPMWEAWDSKILKLTGVFDCVSQDLV